MTKIAITGATGFVGSALVRHLTSLGHTIIALCRPTSDRSVLNGANVQWVEGDVTQPASLDGAFDGAEWLIHAAGLLGQAGISEAQYREIHREGTRNVLANAGSCSRILYISSPGVLGPVRGPAADESTPVAPSNIYEQSKAEAEAVALDYANRGLPVIVARPEFIYGPGDLHVLGLFKTINKGRFFFIAGGNHYCHPTYLDDAIFGMRLCLTKGTPGQIYHIAGPKPVTFRELAGTIALALDREPPRYSMPKPAAMIAAILFEFVGAMLGKKPPLSRSAVNFFSEDRRFSWNKAQRQLGYCPEVDLETGVRRTVEWYRRQNYL